MPETAITTFYSHRGGVGRTMALLNSGSMLAQQGRRVLLVDFDLEAPGLTRLLEDHHLVEDHQQARQAKGVIDLLHQFIYAPDQFAFAVAQEQIDLEPYLVKLAVPPVESPFAQSGSLHLLPAGQLADYAKHLHEVTRRSRLVARVRKQLAERIRQVLVESGRFDYILIDARTGLSDEGYIAAKFMCDSLVVLTGLNDQNLRGTADFLTRVAAWIKADQAPKQLVLVASPVPEYEDDAKDERYEAAKQILGKAAGANAGFAVSLPYHPRVSLYEELVAHRWPDSGLGRAYRRLATILRDLNNDTLAHWASAAAEALRGERINVDACLAALRHVAAIDLEQATRLIENLTSALPLANTEQARAALPLFDEFAKIDPSQPLYPLQKARTLRASKGDPEEVLSSLGQAQKLASEPTNDAALAAVMLERAQMLIDTDCASARDAALAGLQHASKLNDRSLEAQLLFQAGLAERLLGAYAQSRERFQQVQRLRSELNDTRGVSSAMYWLAELDMLQGRYDEARKGFEEALAIKRDLGDRREISVTLYSLAELDRLQGRYDEARKGFEEVLAIVRDLGDRRAISATLHFLADLDRLQGRYDEARKGFDEALAIDRDLGDRREISVTQVYLEVARAQSDPSLELDALERAVRRATEASDPHVGARALELLGVVLRERGDYPDALARLSDALCRAEEHGFRDLAARAQAESALALAELGRSDEAATAAGEAIVFFDEQDVKYPRREELDELAGAED